MAQTTVPSIMSRRKRAFAASCVVTAEAASSSPAVGIAIRHLAEKVGELADADGYEPAWDSVRVRASAVQFDDPFSPIRAGDISILASVDAYLREGNSDADNRPD